MQALLDDLGSADSMYRSMYESSTNAAGSAEAENAKYMESLEARIALARVEVEKLALAMGEAFLQEGMIQAIKVFGDMLGVLTKLTSSIGALPIILGATGVAVFALSSRFRTLVAAIAMGTTSMNTNKAASIGMTTGMTGAAVATTTLKTAMRGLLAASGVGLVLVGIGMAAEFLIGKIGDAREKSEELATFNKNLASSYSGNKDTIDELSASYIELDNKRASGELGLDEQKEYLDVQNQLAELLPDLVLAEDAKGNKILGGSEIVKGHIELLRERLAIEKELKAEEDKKQSEERYDTAKGSYNDVKKEIDGVLDYIDTAVRSVNQQFGSQLDFTKIFSVDPNDLKSYDDVLAKLEQLNQKKNEIKANDDNYKDNKIYQYYDQASQAIAQYTQKYNDASMQQRSYLQAMKAEVLSQASSVIIANENMSESARNFASELASTATKGSTTASQLDKIKDSIINLKIDDSTIASIKTFEDSFSSASKSTSDNVDEMKDKLISSSGEMKKALLDASGLDINSDAYKNLSSVLDQLVDSKIDVIDKAYEMAEAEGISFDQAINNIAMLEEEGDATSALADERYNLLTVTEQLSGVSQNLIDDTDDLLFAYDDLILRTGDQAFEDEQLIAVKQRLLDLYPHLFDANTTALNMTDDQINGIRAEVKANDVLMAAYAAKRDGKLTTEQEATTAQLANVNARIKNINAEIDGLSKLAAAYRNFAGSAIETANEYAKAGLDGEAEEAYIRAQKFSGFARKQEGLAHAELAKNTAERTRLTNVLSKSMEVANRTTTGGNRAARDSAKASDKASKAKGKNAAASKKQTKAQKEATKAMEQSIFVANKYKRALEDLELQIKKQQDIQSKFPEYNTKYKNALVSEIALQKEKKKLLENQNTELQKQIKAGNILKTGVVTTTTTTGTSKTVKASGFSGKINSNVGYRTDPVTGKRGAYHAGVDLQAANGTRLDAPVSGKVIRNAKVGQYGGLGNAIVIQDANGLKHIFGHLSKSIVKLGQQVTAGQQIGNTGNTGKSTGPHLHYELRDAKGNVMNPSSYINAAKKGISTNGTMSTVSKEVAQNQYDIESAQSELTGIASSIIEQQALIEQLEMDLIKTELAVYTQRRDSYDRAISYESEKIKTLDVNSQRYGATIERIGGFLKDKQKANQDELKYIEAQIKKGKLSAIVLDEMKIRAEILKTEMLGLADAISKNNYEVILVSLQRYQEKMDDLAYSIQRSQLIMATFEEGSADYNKELKYQITLLKQQADATKAEHTELQKKLLTVKLGTEEYAALAEEIQKLSLEYWQLQGSIKDSDKALADSNKKFAEEAADVLIDSYKQYLEQKQEMHLKSLDKLSDAEDKQHKKNMDNYKEELDAFRKIVQEKIDSIDKEESERDYNKEIDDLQKQRNDLNAKMKELEFDNSHEAKSERKKIQEEISKIDESITEKRHDREVELRKENLGNMIKDKEDQIAKEEEAETERHDNEMDRINKLKEYWTQFYTDQLNDERRFAQIKEQIVSGNFDNLSKEFQDYMKEMEETMPDLENTLDGTMKAVGTSIRQNIIDNLKEALEMLNKVNANNSNTPSSGTGSGSSSEGSTGGNGQTGIGTEAGVSTADLKVMTAKFLAEKVNREEKNPVRQQYIRERASQMANQGRAEGSKITEGFDTVMSKMSQDDKIKFASYLQTVGVSTVSTPELQDFIRQYAKNLGSGVAHLSTGGYTGDFAGGKMAVLHEKEVILNKKETKDLFSILPHLQKLANLVTSPKLGSLANSETMNSEPIVVEFNIENMNGTQQEADSFATKFVNAMSRKRGRK